MQYLQIRNNAYLANKFVFRSIENKIFTIPKIVTMVHPSKLCLQNLYFKIIILHAKFCMILCNKIQDSAITRKNKITVHPAELHVP